MRSGLPGTVLVAPCSFKGSLGPVQAAGSIARGLRAASPGLRTLECPLADGGEGTLEVLLAALGGQRRFAAVRDPLSRPVRASWGVVPERGAAIVEVAEAIGLPLLAADERDPRVATSYGAGELVRAALDEGWRRIWIGLGGSGTVDGGTGMLQALGARLLGAGGAELSDARSGLLELESLDLAGLDPRLGGTELTVLCDVASPLLGAGGARLYMQQKGADAAACDALERALGRFAAAVRAACGAEVHELPGAGAAGGLGAAFAALGARLASGSEFVFESLDVRGQLERCTLVVGGEGRLDEQTLEGKPILGLARLARRQGRPLIVLCGSRAEDLSALLEAGVTCVLPIVPGPTTEAAALREGERNLEQAAYQLGRLLEALPGQQQA